MMYENVVLMFCCSVLQREQAERAAAKAQSGVWSIEKVKKKNSETCFEDI
jgi:hypothetical protein